MSTRSPLWTEPTHDPRAVPRDVLQAGDDLFLGTVGGDMLETFKRQPGFIRYGLADTGEGNCVSISLWETHAQADAATTVSATWVREHLADRVELRSNQVGDLAFYEGVRAAV